MPSFSPAALRGSRLFLLMDAQSAAMPLPFGAVLQNQAPSPRHGLACEGKKVSPLTMVFLMVAQAPACNLNLVVQALFQRRRIVRAAYIRNPALTGVLKPASSHPGPACGDMATYQQATAFLQDAKNLTCWKNMIAPACFPNRAFAHAMCILMKILRFAQNGIFRLPEQVCRMKYDPPSSGVVYENPAYPVS
jgi:hypothetical protein